MTYISSEMHESSYCTIYPFSESKDDTVITSNAIKRRPTSSQRMKRKIVNYAEEMHRAKMAKIARRTRNENEDFAPRAFHKGTRTPTASDRI